MAINLYQHNQVAYDATLTKLESTDKSAIIHPAGTEKSLIDFKLCTDFSDITIYWLFLSKYIKIQLEDLKSASNNYVPDNIREIVNELFDGKLAREMTRGEAIVNGILNSPKCVHPVFSYQKGLKKHKKRVRATMSKVAHDSAERYLEALRRIFEKAEGLAVVFNKHITEKATYILCFIPIMNICAK